MVGAGSTLDLQNSWSLVLTRSGSSAGYGAYTVKFNDQGFDLAGSSIPATINPMSD
jgi:hypothetical protein